MDTLDLATDISEPLADARRSFAALSDDSRKEIREYRNSVYRLRYRVSASGARAFSLRTGDVITGDDIPRVFQSKLHDSLSSEIDAPESYVRVQGYGSVFDVGYYMIDQFGPYVETMSRKAFDASIERGQSLRVSLLRSHAGLGLASTESRRMAVGVDDYGLGFCAALNPEETDSRDLIEKLQAGSTPRDTSIGGQIRDYSWDDDFTHITINDWWMSRGEISAVQIGANPAGFIMLRSESLQSKLAAVEAVQINRKLRI